MTIFEKKALILQNFVAHYCGNNWDAAIVHLCLADENELSDLMGGAMDVPDLMIRHINLLQGEEEFRSKKQTRKSSLEAENKSLHEAMIAQQIDFCKYLSIEEQAFKALNKLKKGQIK
ncbi:MAG: hypothetical protein JXQ68_05015 [Campylobacterales bacterium]|nr:hypothetical protein [Campylobacterales bacterium]